ncbi:hypothetical protein [Clostridium thermobutyricum]|uniref:hypothetical protein n=1 Tax=Clostridium thermobutyricum TaxID=29372 RepID=UPI0018AB7896|nr:hypothetical protein [Clostridium thermobutyricum]
MTKVEFLAVLKDFINDTKQTISKLECSNKLDQVDTDKMNNIKEMFEKLEQDYFQNNAKEFDEDGNLKKTTIEQVREGLLNIFNKYVEAEMNNGELIGSYDLCQIADRLLQIESIEKFR